MRVKSPLCYFINWIVAAKTIQTRKMLNKGNYSRKRSMFDEKYCSTFGDLLTSFLVKNADSRWWIGKSPIGNRTTLVRGCGVDIPYARMKNWKEGEKKEDHSILNWKDSMYNSRFRFLKKLSASRWLEGSIWRLKLQNFRRLKVSALLKACTLLFRTFWERQRNLFSFEKVLKIAALLFRTLG